MDLWFQKIYFELWKVDGPLECVHDGYFKLINNLVTLDLLDDRLI